MLSTYGAISFKPAENITGIMGLYDWRKPALDDPAARAITDFFSRQPITLKATDTVIKAKQIMVNSHMDFALVLNDKGDFCGGICSTDFDHSAATHQLESAAMENRLVHEFMTPKHQLSVLSMTDLRRAPMGTLLRTLEQVESQHILISHNPELTDKILGLISARDLARLFRIPFAESGQESFQTIVSAIIAG